MNKRSTILRSIVFLSLAVLVVFAGQTLYFLLAENASRSPAYFSAYTDSGYYEINPKTIMGTLDHGGTNVFTPFYGDPDRDKPEYHSIAWTQPEYLEIANALSLEKWNEPLDLKTWKPNYISFIRSCNDDVKGFNTFTIVYYKEIGIKNWQRHYITRLIEIYPWQGLVRWGKDAEFSAPMLLGWTGANLNSFKITADDALQIAEAHGGLSARSKANDCRIILSVNQLSLLAHAQNWLVDYDRANFYMHINPYTGEYKILQ